MPRKVFRREFTKTIASAGTTTIGEFVAGKDIIVTSISIYPTDSSFPVCSLIAGGGATWRIVNGVAVPILSTVSRDAWTWHGEFPIRAGEPVMLGIRTNENNDVVKAVISYVVA